jgi:hypothetical protein
MNDMTTPNYGLTKPDVGGSDDTWGEKLNVNFDILDTTLKDISNVIPVVPPPISPSSTTPLVESGAGSAGVATAYSRGDHVHPAGPTPPSPATVVPLVESGTGAIGISLKYAREDHIHPLGPGGGGGGGASVTTSDTPPVGAANGDLWWESDTGILYVNYNDGTSTQWVSVYGGIAGNYVAKTGDTMTGALSITMPSPGIYLNAAAGTGASIIGTSVGALRWLMQYQNGDPESGGNTGSNFALWGYNDAQNALTGTLTIIRSDFSMYYSGAIRVNSTLPSTSPSTGALTVAGGMGIVGNVFAGGNVSGADLYASRGPTEGVLWLGGDATYIHNTGPSLTLNGKPVGVTNTTASTSAITGALVVAGGVGISGALNVGTGSAGIATFNGRSDGLTFVASNGNVGQAYFTLGNAGSRSWQFAVAGTAHPDPGCFYWYDQGVGAYRFGISASGGINLGFPTAGQAAGSLNIPATTPSTSLTTGALTVAGGVGIAGTLNSGPQVIWAAASPTLNFLENSAVVLTVTAAATTSYLDYGAGLVIRNRPGSYVTNLAMNAASIAVPLTTASTSVSTGALTVAGGVGISGELHIPTAGPTVNTTQAMNMATHGAWQSWTPTVTSAVSGPPAVTTTCRYKQINKMVFFTAVIVITAQNGAGTAIAFTLPVTAASQDFTFVGRENAVTGSLLVCWTPDTTHISIQRYDGTYLGANGHRLVVSGSYEAA